MASEPGSLFLPAFSDPVGHLLVSQFRQLEFVLDGETGASGVCVGVWLLGLGGETGAGVRTLQAFTYTGTKPFKRSTGSKKRSECVPTARESEAGASPTAKQR